MLVILSPHLDDAAYSCGGSIYQWVQRGETVHVWTLMAGSPPSPPPDTPIVRDVHQRWNIGDDPTPERRREDERALALLGAQCQHHHLPDCIYRTHQGTALYPDDAALFGAVHDDDPAAPALDALLATLPADTWLLAPLGVGQHVDHQLVRDAALRLKRQRQHLKLWLYADYPYWQQAGSIERARMALGRPLREHSIHLSDAAMTAKIGAMQAYASQITTFWRDATHLAQAVRQAFWDETQQHNAERYWHL